jgi:hypothetical protein
LISFETHEPYIDKLFRRLNTEPPANYQARTMSQLLRADRQVWAFLSQNVSDIRPGADRKKPLDKALDDALMDYKVTFHLLPLPIASQSSYAPLRNRDGQSQASGRDEQSYKGYGFGHGKKGKGKPKSNQQGSGVAPGGIKGAVGRDSRGRALP